jgi:hypothetical protein
LLQENKRTPIISLKISRTLFPNKLSSLTLAITKLQNTVRKFFPIYVEVRREFTEVAAYKKQLVKSHTGRWLA